MGTAGNGGEPRNGTANSFIILRDGVVGVNTTAHAPECNLPHGERLGAQTGRRADGERLEAQTGRRADGAA
jgi:hypothetical protein